MDIQPCNTASDRVFDRIHRGGCAVLRGFTKSLRGSVRVSVNVEHSVALVACYAVAGYLVASALN